MDTVVQFPFIGFSAERGRRSISKTIVDTWEDNELPCLQVYAGNSQSLRRSRIPDAERKLIKQKLIKTGQSLLCHASNNVNLARPFSETEIHVKSLFSDVEGMIEVGCSTVVHMGSHLDQYSASDVIRNLEMIEMTVDDPTFCPILLENSSGNKGKGTKLGSTWDELEFLAQGVGPQIGFCIDTQHTFSAGLCDFSTPDAVMEFFKTLDVKIGGEKIKAFHLNDSEVPFGDMRDKHAPLFRGHIWGTKTDEEMNAFRTLVFECGRRYIPMITETTCKDDPLIAYKACGF